jgi:hypothetical protein
LQLDVAWTDLLLAIAALYAARLFLAQRETSTSISAAGLLLLALAAGLGALRFSIFPWLAPLHALATGCAGAIGLPLLGVGYWLAASPEQEKHVGRVVLAVCLVGLAMVRVRLYWIVVSTIGMMIGVWSGLLLGRRQAVAGSLLIMLSGLVLGEGRWAGMERNAWFHLVMALACWLHGAGLRPRGR